ncbi:hypothetical protein ACLB2K_056093 [Fragaria x ananassa]
MARKKVKLAYITDDSARKATFKKRKKGLMKKGVQSVLARFNSMPSMDQSKKMFNQDTYLRERIGKVQEQLKNQKKENRKKEIERVMFQSLTGKSLQGLMHMDLKDLDRTIDQHLEQIQSRVKSITEEALKNQSQEQGASVAADHKPDHVIKRWTI